MEPPAPPGPAIAGGNRLVGSLFRARSRSRSRHIAVAPVGCIWPETMPLRNRIQDKQLAVGEAVQKVAERESALRIDRVTLNEKRGVFRVLNAELNKMIQKRERGLPRAPPAELGAFACPMDEPGLMVEPGLMFMVEPVLVDEGGPGPEVENEEAG